MSFVVQYGASNAESTNTGSVKGKVFLCPHLPLPEYLWGASVTDGSNNRPSEEVNIKDSPSFNQSLHFCSFCRDGDSSSRESTDRLVFDFEEFPSALPASSSSFRLIGIRNGSICQPSFNERGSPGYFEGIQSTSSAKQVECFVRWPSVTSQKELREKEHESELLLENNAKEISNSGHGNKIAQVDSEQKEEKFCSLPVLSSEPCHSDRERSKRRRKSHSRKIFTRRSRENTFWMILQMSNLCFSHSWCLKVIYHVVKAVHYHRRRGRSCKSAVIRGAAREFCWWWMKSHFKQLRRKGGIHGGSWTRVLHKARRNRVVKALQLLCKGSGISRVPKRRRKWKRRCHQISNCMYSGLLLPGKLRHKVLNSQRCFTDSSTNQNFLWDPADLSEIEPIYSQLSPSSCALSLSSCDFSSPCSNIELESFFGETIPCVINTGGTDKTSWSTVIRRSSLKAISKITKLISHKRVF